MFDKVTGSVTGFLKNYALGFAVAAAVASIILDLIGGEGVNVEELIQVVVTAVVAGTTASAVIGGVDSL